jgi:hypothetical protein
MPDLLLKDFSREELDRLTQVAQAAGLDRMNWAKQVLLHAASAPLVRKRYAYRGYASANGARLVIRRLGDAPEPVGGELEQADPMQSEADRRARELIGRNEPGDREQALRLLHEAGFELFEIPV